MRRGGGGVLPYLAHTGQVCAAEHKVLSIKQGVEFCNFNSKILIFFYNSLLKQIDINTAN